MNTDAEYVVIDRAALKKVLIDATLGAEFKVDNWIDENELPLMTIPEFQKDMVNNTQRWFPDMIRNGTIDLNMILYGLGGEVGECLDWMKKFIRGSITQQELIEKLAEESVDAFHYICLLWFIFGIDPGVVYHNKTIENEKRFGPKDAD